MTPADAQRILDENFAEWVLALQPEVLSIDKEHALVRMPVGQHLIRVGGIVSGQAMAALADTVMVLAALAHAGEFKPFATTDLSTQFLRPASGKAILCRASVVRAGKAMTFTRAEMSDEESGKLVSTATATFFAG